MKRLIFSILIGVCCYASTFLAVETIGKIDSFNRVGDIQGTTYQLAEEDRRRDGDSKRFSGPSRMSATPEYVNGQPVKYQAPPTEAKTEPLNYLLIWSADWCKNCPDMKKIGDKLAKEGFEVIHIDFDSNQKRAKEDKVGSLPMAVVYTDGEEIVRIIGLGDGKKSVETQIRKVLKKNIIEYSLY